ncbi:putative 2-aminoethylphosphonate ABC transporter ATP-binding protein [Pseudomonas sp. RIT-PI-S]|uniref:putative 2-aminoethylphosphonate ABC transporter ATP-binding protein n=1 Tax=Pseudomonas sp. RIT-PI-S TaxID=3035295 RepID=UPI0021D92097|nr:putative 2-aminoethylphosphonate ABC transporter ATP-binding protein [Pseudomonas sp. RIT-PI-S]
MGTVSLHIGNLHKAFGAFKALDGVSLEVRPGELVCLLGPSGCGKTTLLRCLAGLERQDAGQIRFGERDVSTLPPQARDYGIVFQSYALFPNLTVAENIAYGLAGQGRHAIRARVAQMLDLVGLAGAERRFPGQLSGGQQQRVALARALAPSPQLLLLDEPMSALDAQVREHLCGELRQLQQQLGVTTLMVTHNQDEAMMMADRIAVLHQGRVEQFGTAEQLYQAPATPFVARFFGQGNWLPFQREGDHARVGDLDLRLPARPEHSRGRLFCRPEALVVNPLVHEDNLFCARLQGVTFLGNRCRLALELNELPGHRLQAEVPAQGVSALRQGPLWVALPPRHLQVFA